MTQIKHLINSKLTVFNFFISDTDSNSEPAKAKKLKKFSKSD